MALGRARTPKFAAATTFAEALTLPAAFALKPQQDHTHQKQALHVQVSRETVAHHPEEDPMLREQKRLLRSR